MSNSFKTHLCLQWQTEETVNYFRHSTSYRILRNGVSLKNNIQMQLKCELWYNVILILTTYGEVQSVKITANIVRCSQRINPSMVEIDRGDRIRICVPISTCFPGHYWIYFVSLKCDIYDSLWVWCHNPRNVNCIISLSPLQHCFRLIKIIGLTGRKTKAQSEIKQGIKEYKLLCSAHVTIPMNRPCKVL